MALDFDYEQMAQDFEAQHGERIEVQEQTEAPQMLTPVPKEGTAMVEQPQTKAAEFAEVVGSVQSNILEKAKEKIADNKIVEKHAENLKELADKTLEVQAETASLEVQEQEADNKVRKQEIRNKLIVLKAEAIRLEKEQKQLNREQKADHKRRNKEAKWELYKDKLTKMKYTYVPCAFVLAMLLFFDGVRSFFEGLGTINKSIVKAFWIVFVVGAVLIVLFAIPVTNEWLTNLLKGGH